MIKWAYCYEYLGGYESKNYDEKLLELLKEKGKQGWELVSNIESEGYGNRGGKWCRWGRLVFKRSSGQLERF